MAGALGLDLGTTRIKAGWVDESGALAWTIARDAPKPGDAGTGDPRVRELPAEAYATTAEHVMRAAIEKSGADVALGVASQRSSFLLWDRESGEPRTPLVSWQDRRAEDWCGRHRELEPDLRRYTGLVLSPHYAGPKLASMLEQNADLARQAGEGELLFGTLETWLYWRWTEGRAHVTDLTMAARTLLANAGSGEWSAASLRAFGVPASLLPAIGPTRGLSIALAPGARLVASLADQASGALAVFGKRRDCVLVNLGTGGFVLAPTGKDPRLKKGFLAGPIFGSGGHALYASEGTINGAGPAVDACGPGPTDLTGNDPCREGFCIPDTAGIGSPHWRADMRQTWSDEGSALTTRGKRRIVLEGIVFRVREIIDALGGRGGFDHVMLSGGLSRDPFVAPALAACLEQPVHVLAEAETTLLGAARLAAGLDPCAEIAATPVEAGRKGAYLAAKYSAWKTWAAGVLAASV